MARKRKAKTITSREQFTSLSASERLSSHRALRAINLMRRGNLSLTAAARQAETTVDTVTTYAAPALTQSGVRYIAQESDTLFRRMTALSANGLVEVDVYGSESASEVAEHMNAVRHFLNTGDTTVLRDFEGKEIDGTVLLTDPQRIEELAFRHELEFEDIYQNID